MTGAAAPLRSAVLTGRVGHARVRPEPHDFTYDVWQLLLDVDELDRLDREVAGFGWNRRAPVNVRATDHLGDVDLPLREKLRRFLAGQGIALPDGVVLLQTTPRVLGYGFNPVSWWWCHDTAGELALVVAEVNNTFGDTHCYVLDELVWTGDHRVEARDTKVFHVSPFMDVEGLDYRFVFRPPSVDGDGPSVAGRGERIGVHMDVSDAEGHLFGATTGHSRAPLTTRSLWRQVLRMPWVTLKTIAAIHWQAAFIWRRKAAFRSRPEPPPTGYDAIATPVHAAPEVRDAG